MPFNLIWIVDVRHGLDGHYTASKRNCVQRLEYVSVLILQIFAQFLFEAVKRTRCHCTANGNFNIHFPVFHSFGYSAMQICKLQANKLIKFIFKHMCKYGSNLCIGASIPCFYVWIFFYLVIILLVFDRGRR